MSENQGNPQESRSLAPHFNQAVNPFAPVYNPAIWGDAGENWQKAAFIALLNRHPAINICLKRLLQSNIFDRQCFDPASGSPNIEILNALYHILTATDQSIQALSKATGAAFLRFKDDYRKTLPHIQLRTNCYAHAVNYQADGELPGVRLQPGDLSGKPFTIRTDSEDHYFKDLVDGITRDGGKLFFGNTLPPLREGFYRASLLISYKTPDLRDFHCTRENRDGTISHKPGHTPSDIMPNFPRRLPSPCLPAPYIHTAFFYIPEGGLTKRTPAAP